MRVARSALSVRAAADAPSKGPAMQISQVELALTLAFATVAIYALVQVVTQF